MVTTASPWSAQNFRTPTYSWIWINDNSPQRGRARPGSPDRFQWMNNLSRIWILRSAGIRRWRPSAPAWPSNGLRSPPRPPLSPRRTEDRRTPWPRLRVINCLWSQVSTSRLRCHRNIGRGLLLAISPLKIVTLVCKTIINGAVVSKDPSLKTITAKSRWHLKQPYKATSLALHNTGHCPEFLKSGNKWLRSSEIILLHTKNFLLLVVYMYLDIVY